MAITHVKLTFSETGGGQSYPIQWLPPGNHFELEFPMQEKYVETIKRLCQLISREHADLAVIKAEIDAIFGNE